MNQYLLLNFFQKQQRACCFWSAATKRRTSGISGVPRCTWPADETPSCRISAHAGDLNQMENHRPPSRPTFSRALRIKVCLSKQLWWVNTLHYCTPTLGGAVLAADPHCSQSCERDLSVVLNLHEAAAWHRTFSLFFFFLTYQYFYLLIETQQVNFLANCI